MKTKLPKDDLASAITKITMKLWYVAKVKKQTAKEIFDKLEIWLCNICVLPIIRHKLWDKCKCDDCKKVRRFEKLKKEFIGEKK